MSFDLNALMKQAQEMQAQMAQVQEEAAKETAEASAGGGMVTVVASAAGEIKELRIDPKAIDPDDPETARRPRDGRRERSAALGAGQGRGEDEEHAAVGSRRLAARALGRSQSTRTSSRSCSTSARSSRSRPGTSWSTRTTR